MKITVIVPVYNRLEHLRALCQCLIRQEEKPYELIITDDGSSQKVVDFIGDLLPKMDFKVKHIYQEDLGFRKTRALNNAVREAEGDILVFCDQDLIFGNDYLKKMKENIKENIFLMCRPYNSKEKERKHILEKLEKGEKYSEIVKLLPEAYSGVVKELLKKDRYRRIMQFLKLNKRGIKLLGMSYCLIKNSYIKVNGYDEKYMGWGEEDDDFGNRLTMAGIKGKELKTDEIQLHIWHKFDPTKKESANREYYLQRKKEIFSKKDYFCKYGYDNQLMQDKVQINVLK